jgi:chemotaxis protein CheZ
VTTPPDRLGQRINQDIKAEIVPLFDELRRFTDRRIAELSAEIHATVQMVDFSEVNRSNQLAKIQEQVAVMVAMPAAATRNSGLELEAVVQATEAAANQIMEAAEAIGDWLRDGSRDVGSLELVAAKLNSIFEACTFQDVTGQRIRRAIQHLQHVENMLIEISPHHAEPASADRVVVNPDLVQEDVDRVFQAALQPTIPAGENELVEGRDGGLAPDNIDLLFQLGAQPAPMLIDGTQAGLDQDNIDAMFQMAARSPLPKPVNSTRPGLDQGDIDRMFG